MLTTILAAALVASTPTPAKPATKDMITAICTERFVENFKLVAEGGQPTSMVIPLLGLSDEVAAYVTQQCDQFDRGAFLILSLKSVPVRNAPKGKEIGRVPDRRAGPISF